MLALNILTILISGLMIGVELAVSAFINPTMRKLDPEPQARALQLFAKLLGRVMPFWYALCLLLFLAEAIVYHATPAFIPLIVAICIWTAIIVFTIAVLVPINNRIAALSTASLPPGWQQAHARWDRLHILRVALLIIAYILVLYAILA